MNDLGQRTPRLCRSRESGNLWAGWLFSRSEEGYRTPLGKCRGSWLKTMGKQFFVYILASKRNGTLYTGVTSALVHRVWQHKTKAVEGFTARYGVDRLVYFEVHADAASAIAREKQIKKWERAWKIRLIEKINP